MRQLAGLLVSDFNIGNFSRYLENDEAQPPVACAAAPYGQVIASLLDPSATAGRRDFAVVWAAPEHVSPAFARSVEGHEADTGAVLADVDAFCAAVRSCASRVDVVFVAAWVPTRETPSSLLLDMRSGTGGSRLLLEMNLRLAEGLQDVANAYVLDASRWMAAAPGRARDPKLWYLAKVPFANEVFASAARDVKSCLRGLKGGARKLLVLDLDDTLWGGLVGDVGWERLRIGGHDALGESFADFQRGLKALTRRGVILGIVSKNESHLALEAVDRHPEMVLRRGDFAGWRINREDKARNIVELTHELNLGLDAVVFIDDSAAERARVRDALPEVLVPEWPSDPMLYPRALADLRAFDTPALTAEDAGRTGMYVTERQRSELLQRIGSVDDWLKSLGLRVSVEDVAGANFDRALQLLNKTNQMNLATRRCTAGELREWLAAPGRRSWCFRVSDRLGDSGITGLLSVEGIGSTAHIVDFVLSCRVMGRKVEETMLHVAVAYARAAGLQEVRADYAATPRNRPCLEFLQRAGLTAGPDGHVFTWRADAGYALPDAIALTVTFPIEGMAACPAPS